jgi:sialate O-acetylesterase
MKKVFFLLFFVSFYLKINAQLRLPKLVSDGMILQRQTPLKLWGWDSEGAKIQVKFQNKIYKTVASKSGNWQLTLPTFEAGGPYQMEVSDAKTKITINDVLIGDVWFCSGQSNMVHQLNIHDVTYAKEIAEANFPQIRQFWVPTLTNTVSAQEDIPNGQWKKAVGEEVRPFSAVAYFFAKKLHQKYQIPIGIINASVGGTPIEAWISEGGLPEIPNIKELVNKNKDTARINETNRKSLEYSRSLPQSSDEGMMGKWYETTYVPKNWKNINVPGYWEDQGIRNLDGIVWYRKEVNIPASMIGKKAKVFLGRIVDADELYINGKRVGSTGYMYPQRRYAVASDILKEGVNTFVVRVTNNGGKGGFVPDKPYCIFSEKDTIDLKGTWQYKVGAVFQRQNNPNAVSPISLQNQPTALYNAMVAHAIPYAIKGICWYQGETNTGKSVEYAQLLPALIKDWRQKWNNTSLPFLYVQLPGFMDYDYLPSESSWAVLRESQAKALSVPNTAMTVAIDLGEWNDIHPDNKKDVGERLALSALKLAYHENVIHSGPSLLSSEIKDQQIILTFDNIGSGLKTKDGEPIGDLAIAGADKKFVWSKSKIEGNKIIVWAEGISNPKFVRYAWSDNPINPNLINAEGLPASPFRTDN